MAFDPGIRRALVDILGEAWVKDDAVTLYSYRCDGLTLHTALPMGVVFPRDTAQVAAVVALLSGADISFLPRGAGTGLSGGAVPREGSVVIEMFRLREVHEVDPINRTITVGPGVVNLHVSECVKPHGLQFVPDPSSQKACTVGGNVGENSGGPHTLKYGVTVNHVLGMEVVLPDGEVVQLGGAHWGQPGPDLLGLFVGSEGTFGIVTKIVCRLTPLPQKAVTLLGVFASVRDACEGVSGIIRRGVVPAALEMIDNVVIRAVQTTMDAGFPLDAQAVLIVELEDLADGIDEDAAGVEAILLEHGATEVRRAADDAERALIWKARKGAFGALGAISPSYYTQDGVIPRSALPRVLDRVLAVGAKYGLRVANVFHAGDGNLHPLILYNSQDARQIEDTHRAGKEILEICLEHGGTLSGEHGIGLEKASLMGGVYSEADLDNMQWVRSAFNPRSILNPNKIFPTPGRCGETKIRPPGDDAVMVGRKSGVAV